MLTYTNISVATDKQKLQNQQSDLDSSISEAKDELEDIKKEKINNNLVFLKTESDNTYCLRDLNGIKREYYKSFKDLLMSIKNGTFKNVKRLTTTNSKLNSISEVRGFKTRVIFDRIDSKTYIILMCAVKKSDFDLGYQNLLEGRCLKYRCFKNTIFEKKMRMNLLRKI